jgi:carbon-monoxide dehydrogenase medium subunit
MTPALGADEMLTAVRFPRWKKGHGHAFVEFARRHGDFAIVSAAALLEADAGGRIARASVTIGGIGPAPVRVTEVERALVGNVISDALLRDASEQCRKLEATGDVHAPAAYRQQLAGVLARRALEQAHARVAR